MVVAREGLRASREEEWIVFAPYSEKRRLSRADVILELRVERDVVLIVTEQIEFDLVIVGPGEKRRVKSPGIR